MSAHLQYQTAVHQYSMYAVYWPTVEVRLQDEERPVLLQLRPPRVLREGRFRTESGRSQAGLCSAIFDPKRKYSIFGCSESSDNSHPFHYEQNPLLLQTHFILDKAGTFSQNSVELLSPVLQD